MDRGGRDRIGMARHLPQVDQVQREPRPLGRFEVLAADLALQRVFGAVLQRDVAGPGLAEMRHRVGKDDQLPRIVRQEVPQPAPFRFGSQQASGRRVGLQDAVARRVHQQGRQG